MLPLLLFPLALAGAARGTPGASGPAAQSAATVDSVRVGEFLAYDASRRTAWLTLAAGRDGDNGGMSFNGAHEGAHTITIPRGWTVVATFVNEGGPIPHSAQIVGAATPVPMAPVASAFEGAETRSAESGLAEGERDAFTFVAAKPGAYLVYCGVAGHAQAGMWLRLIVSPTARTPSYS